MTWLKDELKKIAGADDLHVSPFREDGVTYGTPTWIWSVAVNDALFVLRMRIIRSGQYSHRGGGRRQPCDHASSCDRSRNSL
jgi:hypothetical protein